MGALRAFSVVAEIGSVSGAAEILGVTHSAVSKQLRTLEDWLGQALFLRKGRQLVLSPFGRLLAQKVRPAIQEMVEACDQAYRRRGRRIVTIEAPATFAMYWLMPRLDLFKRSEPHVDVWVSTRMTEQHPDLARHDIVILRGRDRPPPLVAKEPYLLAIEENTVIMSNDLIAGAHLTSASDILNYPLIGSSTRPDDWPSWLALARLRFKGPGGGHRFDHLFVAIQAVRDGFGTIVAPRNVLSFNIARGELVCPFPNISFEGQPYLGYVVSSSAEAHVSRFLEWLCTNGQ